MYERERLAEDRVTVEPVLDVQCVFVLALNSVSDILEISFIRSEGSDPTNPVTGTGCF